MADTTFVNKQTVVQADWLNDVNDVTYFQNTGTGATKANLLGRLQAEVWARDFGHSTSNTAAQNDTALLAAIQAVYNRGGGTVYLESGAFAHSSVSFNWTGTISVNIVGQGMKATFLQKTGVDTSPILNLSADSMVLDTYSSVRLLSITGNSKLSSGILATRLATFITEEVFISGCDVAFDSVGSLVCIHYRPKFTANNYNYRSRKSGTIYCNAVSFYNPIFGGASTYCMDIGDASGVFLYNPDFEQNGTLGNTSTGCIILRSTCDDEFGYANFGIFGGWLEANRGGYSIQAEACGGLSVSLIGVLIGGSESGRALDVSAGIKSLELINIISATPGDTVTTGATPTTIMGGTISVITGTAVTLINAADSTGTRPFESRTVKVGSGGLKVDPTTYISDTGSTFTQGNVITRIRDNAGSGGSVDFYMANGAGGNAAATVVKLTANSSTSRSINAGGTVNTSGADYAEYERKNTSCGIIQKGDLVGFDSDGLLTDSFDHAVSFGIKSTSPSFVGGDTWGEHLTGDALEEERVKWDRIAYSGKVPVNVVGVNVGDYIYAGNLDGKIIPLASSSKETNTVGRVRAILEDGRALVNVIMD